MGGRKIGIIFKQTRIGQHGKPFTIYKLRTMENGVPTRLGSILRRYRIDELPQIVNILKREMNLVGPRPLIPEEHYKYREGELPVKPGIAGLWVAKSGDKNEIDFWDNVHIMKKGWYGWKYDIYILLITVKLVIWGK